MPKQKRAIPGIPTDAEIGRAYLDEIKTILNSINEGMLQGTITAKECNKACRSVGGRLRTINKALPKELPSDDTTRFQIWTARMFLRTLRVEAAARIALGE